MDLDSLRNIAETLELSPAAARMFQIMALLCCGLAGGSLAYAIATAAPDTTSRGAAGTLTGLGHALSTVLRWNPAQSRAAVRWQAWRELEGKPLSLPFVIGVAAALGLAGLGVGLVLSPLMGLIGALAGGAAYPLLINSQVNGQMTDFRRGLPSSIILLLAEHRAGASIEGSIERLAERPGPMARFLQDALDRTRLGTEPLFSRGESPGALARRASQLGMPELQHLIHTLEVVENQGRAGNEVMDRLNSMQIIDLNKRSTDQLNALERRMVVMIAVFFLFPIMGLMLLSMFVPLLSAF